jgi:hypothetical protein
MQIKTISYKRIVNLGNYNSEHLEMYADLEPGEDPIARSLELKEMVLTALQSASPKARSSKETQPVARDQQIEASDDKYPPF